jgi:hypothetical protein
MFFVSAWGMFCISRPPEFPTSMDETGVILNGVKDPCDAWTATSADGFLPRHLGLFLFRARQVGQGFDLAAVTTAISRALLAAEKLCFF